MRRAALAAIVLALALAAAAAGATRLYSSGPLAVEIPDGGSAEHGIEVRDRGPVSRVAVQVRLDHARDSDLTLRLVGPDGTEVTLLARRGGSGRNVGRGRDCGGSLAVFSDDGGEAASAARPPFVEADLRPEEPLRAFRGHEAHGLWKLRVEDAAPGAAGTLRCWKLELSRNVVESRTARSGAVTARLSFRETNDVYRDLRLRIVRAGRTAFAGRPRRVGACACPLNGPVVARPVRVLDLDGDREPEVLVDFFTGGAHCCSYTDVYRWVRRLGTYVPTVGFWGNAGYRLADLDRDGRPELRTADDRFAYAFASFAASADPIRVLRFRQGRFVEVTRRFRRLVAADARSLYALYQRTRRSSFPEVRGVLAAWLADEATLGRASAGWRVLKSAYRRGELGRGSTKDGYPAGRAYLRRLRSFLRRTGYLRS